MLYTDGMENLQQLDRESLQNLIGGDSGTSGVSLIPESLTSILTISVIVSIGLMVVFLVLYGLSVVRKWKVQSAVLHMQKDVAEIKQALVKTENHQSNASRQDKPRSIDVAADN